MLLLSFNLTLFEIIILQLGGIILGVTIYFFWTSNKALSATLKQSKSKLKIAPKKSLLERVGLNIITLDDLQQKVSHLKNKPAPEVSSKPEISSKKTQPLHGVQESFDTSAVASLKDALLKQQQILNTLMAKIGSLEGGGSNNNSQKELLDENEKLEKKIEKLELQLETKDGEIKRIKQQEAVAQQMASRIDEVYKEFDALQQKMASLEKQAGRANELALQLEDVKEESYKLQKELDRKQEKLEELIAESQRLHATLSTTEDKLAEANMQRQQLQKKVQFLQDVNNDMQHVSESNQKLQNELRRIGELESMLSMIAEERDRLLNKGNKE
jgi:chromosome segregation ATPase